MRRGVLAVSAEIDGTSVTVVVVQVLAARRCRLCQVRRVCAVPARGRGSDHPHRRRQPVRGPGDEERNLLPVGDLNDELQAVTTQILYGPPGSQLGTTGFDRPDQGDQSSLWNLAPLLPAGQDYSRIYQGQHELIDHILFSHSLVTKVGQVHAVTDRPLPSLADNPNQRRNAKDSDHAPVFPTLGL